MSMQNLGGQTKSIIAFLKVAYQGKRIPVRATAENVPTGKKNSSCTEKPNVCANSESVQLSFCIYATWNIFSHRATGKAARLLAT